VLQGLFDAQRASCGASTKFKDDPLTRLFAKAVFGQPHWMISRQTTCPDKFFL
jgi:hypothetical protein